MALCVCAAVHPYYPCTIPVLESLQNGESSSFRAGRAEPVGQAWEAVYTASHPTLTGWTI